MSRESKVTPRNLTCLEGRMTVSSKVREMSGSLLLRVKAINWVLWGARERPKEWK